MSLPSDGSSLHGEVTGERLAFSNQSATGQARQHVGNNYNNYNYQYTLRKRKSDDTLRETERSKVLLKAAAEGQTPRVKYLLHLGVNLDYNDDDCFTALHHAVLSGFEDVVEVLLQAGADVNARSLDFGTPLCLAAFRGRENVVKKLLQYRASVDVASRLAGTALHCAVYAVGMPNIAKILITSGADIEATGTVYRELLGRFCYNLSAFASAMRDLTSHYNIGTKLILECQPLVLAVLEGRDDLVDLFLASNCRVNLNYRHFFSPNLSDEFHDVPESVRTSKWTPLMAACNEGNAGLTAQLLRANADVKARNSDGATALHIAAYKGSLSCTQLLVEAGAVLEAADKFSSTPLLNAVIKRHTDVLKCLSDHGAELRYVRLSKLSVFEKPGEGKLTRTLLDEEEIPVRRVRALSDCVATKSGDLAFKKDDIITVVEAVNTRWCKGALSGHIGMFPLDVVEAPERLQDTIINSRAEAVAERRLEQQRNASTEGIRRLRKLVRERYQMEVYVWNKRGVRKSKRKLVMVVCKKSDEILQEIHFIVSTWEEDLFDPEKPEEWEVAKRIQDRLSQQDPHALWGDTPPWDREEVIGRWFRGGFSGIAKRVMLKIVTSSSNPSWVEAMALEDSIPVGNVRHPKS